MTKKIISMALVVIMLFAFSVSTFAAATPTGTLYTETVTDDQITTLTGYVKSDAVFFSVIKYKHDRSVYYDPIITEISSNGDGTYDMAVRSGFTVYFYYTVKIYVAADGEKISDLTYIDKYGEEWNTTDGMEADDDYYKYDSLLQGLFAYGISYLKNLIIGLF